MQQIDCNQSINQIEKNWPGLPKSDNDTLLMPKLQLQTMDLDLLSVRLQQIRKVDSNADHNKTTMIDKIKNNNLGSLKSDGPSTYFDKTDVSIDYDNKTKNYSNRKLIHILKDVKLENEQTVQIISKVNIKQLSDISCIRSEMSKIQESDTQESQAMEIDLNIHDNKKTEVLVPPTQFSDEKKSSQEKIVTFDMMEMNDDKEGTSVQRFISEDCNADDTMNNLNIISVVDEENEKIQDNIVDGSNLDLSQQFIYNEHTILHKMTQDEIITSKFFDNKTSDTDDDSSRVREVDCGKNKMESKTDNQNVATDSPANKNDIISKDMLHEDRKEVPLTGFLFNHGSQGIPDSLNLSESTTGFEEIDGEYPHCIDSNILMSPKADITMEEVDNNVQTNNEGPQNFLTGGRKTGMSFFGWPSGSKKNSDNQKSNSNFNFNFSGEEKKGRGGLFNIFR